MGLDNRPDSTLDRAFELCIDSFKFGPRFGSLIPGSRLEGKKLYVVYYDINGSAEIQTAQTVCCDMIVKG